MHRPISAAVKEAATRQSWLLRRRSQDFTAQLREPGWADISKTLDQEPAIVSFREDSDHCGKAS
jgi:hypothetical protein